MCSLFCGDAMVRRSKMKRQLSEYLIDNNLDGGFQRMLFPLNLMQSVFLQSKFRILHGFVTPNHFRVYVSCFVGAFLIFIINLARVKYNTPDNVGEEFHNTVLFIRCFDTSFYGFFALIVCVANVSHSKSNVELVLKIQQSYRQFSHDARRIKAFQYLNWVHVISMMVLYFLHFIDSYFCGYGVSDFLRTASLAYFDANIIFALRIIKFLKYVLELWKSEVDLFLTTCSKKALLKPYSKETNCRAENLFSIYRDILKAFHLCEKIFLVSIIYLTMEIFFRPLLAIHAFVLANAEKKIIKYLFVGAVHLIINTVSWILKNFCLLVYVCVTYQEFHLAIVGTDASCAVILSDVEASTDVRRLCKKVRRLNKCASAARELHAGGALAVDATLPLRLLALLATYIVVLLQFSFL